MSADPRRGGWQHEGDVARAVARQLQAEWTAPVEDGAEPFVDGGNRAAVAAEGDSLFDRIVFRWRPDEQVQLDRIRAAVDRMVGDLYGDARRSVDSFYARLRVPETDPETGALVVDSDKRVVWVKDSNGREVESWDQMTGQDIEQLLLELSRIRLRVAPQVNELLLEAVFAKHLQEDRHQDAYAELVEETIPGRNAYAARKTRQDKYMAYFCYYLWSSADTLLKEINNFSRVLERVRYWRTEEDKGGKKAPPV